MTTADLLESIRQINRQPWRAYYGVHPAAEVFPPLPPEELEELAEDIQRRGVMLPIICVASLQRRLAVRSSTGAPGSTLCSGSLAHGQRRPRRRQLDQQTLSDAHPGRRRPLRGGQPRPIWCP
jgi:hypothetical protein